MRSKARVVTAVLGWLAVAAGSALVAAPLAVPLAGGEARARWERLCQIRKDKLDRVLPEAMRQNGIDMWVVTLSEGNYDPLYDDLGRGYPGSRLGYYVFTDRGVERIERAALGIDGGKLEACGTYDIVEGGNDLKA
jgi:hypothetical protein